jgi:hypothetical protein
MKRATALKYILKYISVAKYIYITVYKRWNLN